MWREQVREAVEWNRATQCVPRLLYEARPCTVCTQDVVHSRGVQCVCSGCCVEQDHAVCAPRMLCKAWMYNVCAQAVLQSRATQYAFLSCYMKLGMQHVCPGCSGIVFCLGKEAKLIIQPPVIYQWELWGQLSSKSIFFKQNRFGHQLCQGLRKAKENDLVCFGFSWSMGKAGSLLTHPKHHVVVG